MNIHEICKQTNIKHRVFEMLFCATYKYMYPCVNKAQTKILSYPVIRSRLCHKAYVCKCVRNRHLSLSLSFPTSLPPSLSDVYVRLGVIGSMKLCCVHTRVYYMFGVNMVNTWAVNIGWRQRNYRHRFVLIECKYLHHLHQHRLLRQRYLQRNRQDQLL